MRPIRSRLTQVAIVMVAAMLATGPAFADNDKHDKKGKSERHGKNNEAHTTINVDVRFAEPQRVVVQTYYVNEIKAGHCPPGLAKKKNGCLPPGQARKWQMGQRLPRDVVFHELPPPLVVKIGVPPPGYRYVRVANDVLLIALGTGMIMDAITDLGRM